MADDAFFLAFDDLDFVGGHLLTRFQAGKMDLAHRFLPQRDSRNVGFGLAGDQAFRIVIGIANGGAGDVESDVAAADHHHAASDRQPLTERHGAQKIDAAVDALGVGPGQLQHARPLGAYRDDDGLEVAAEVARTRYPGRSSRRSGTPRPSDRISSISASIRSRGRRYAGMPV